MRSLYEAIMDSDDKILKSSEAEIFKSLMLSEVSKPNIQSIRRIWTKFGLDLPECNWNTLKTTSSGTHYLYHYYGTSLIKTEKDKNSDTLSVHIWKHPNVFEKEYPDLDYKKWIKKIEKKLNIEAKDIGNSNWLLLFTSEQ